MCAKEVIEKDYKMHFQIALALGVLAVTLSLFLAPSKVYAQDFVVSDQSSCESLPLSSGSATWDSSSQTCTLGGSFTIGDSSSSLTVSSGIILKTSFTILNFGKIINNGDIIFESGTLDNRFSGTVTNSNGATIIVNSGKVDNYGIFNNDGSIANNNGGIITIYHNSGIPTIGTLSNHGTVTNTGGSLYTAIDNRGIIDNFGSLLNTDGATITNDGLLGGEGNINNHGTITNKNNAYFENIGNNIITNYVDGKIDNYARIYNGGTITNDGTFTNYCGSQFNNQGTLNGNNLPIDGCGTSNEDITNPTVTFTSVKDRNGKTLDQNTITKSRSIMFQFTAKDNEGGSGISTVECKLDSGKYSSCTSPVSFTKLGKGQHTFTVKAIDKSGNSVEESFRWSIKQAK
jgi:hypothetical protein